jgi:Fic family protein
MLSFDPQVIERQQLTHEIASTLAALGEYKGRQDLYRHQSPQVLDSLKHVAMIQSTESSNRIEGVTAAPDRIRALVDEKTKPRDRSEQEIAGYRHVLSTIHDSWQDVPLTPNVVLQLHQDLYRFTARPAGRWKQNANEITEHLPSGKTRLRFKPVSPLETPDAIDRLHQQLAYSLAEGAMHPLLCIATYVLDFLCIHPFLDGNGRLSRLLTLLLLYQTGHHVGRYISLERVIEDSKASYYEALHASSKGWHRGQQSLIPWWEYFLGTLLSAYRQFEERMATASGRVGSKTAVVLSVIDGLPRNFSIREVKELCPGVSIDLIRKVLRAQRDAGHLSPTGTGVKARWVKRDINPSCHHPQSR